jgi:small subunit ribosomal protein S1
MIIDLDAERGRISLSTKQLEPEPGAMVKNRDLVYEKAEEMAAKFREKMLAQKQAKAGIEIPVDSIDSDEISDEILEDVPSAMEEDLPEETPAAVTEATPEAVTEITPAAVAEITPAAVAEETPAATSEVEEEIPPATVE